jgi:hypothetical protein
MTPSELANKLIDFSPFYLEETNDKFDFNRETVTINEGTPIYYDVLETNFGLEIKIDANILNFYNLIVVFGKNQIERQVVNFDYQKLKYSLPARHQFIGLVSSKLD